MMELHPYQVLLRARAIDNQCYVVAAAQVGQHTKQRRSYGHAMVSPTILNCCCFENKTAKEIFQYALLIFYHLDE